METGYTLSQQQYVPLHLHTEYSLLDGAIRTTQLCEFAKENNMPAVAITDHGVMYGALDLYIHAKDIGVKPIIGCEFYVTTGDIKDKSQNNREYFHLVLIAKNETGYKNLIKLVSIAQIDGFYYKPRINHELLKTYHDGLICLSACLQGEICQTLLKKSYQETIDVAKFYKELFNDDYYLEIQDHGLPDQKRTNPDIIKIGKELDIPVVITNDSHYLKKEDANWHDTLLCIQTNSLKEDTNRFRFSNDEFYVKTVDELRESFKWLDSDTFNEAIENTVKVADKCHLIIELGKSFLPPFDVPKPHTAETYLDYLVHKGLKERYGEIDENLENRVRYELGIINKMGFAPYFLIVWDFINESHKQNVPVGPGRGSAAGSLVAYALGITALDPIKHNLLFERFLNPERISMPDVDIDFCIEGRSKIIEYVNKKYGEDHVCQIITFGSLAAKNAFKSVARVYNVPFADANKWSSLIPSGPGVTLKDALADGMELKALYDTDPTVKKIVDMALPIEGLKQNIGTHAAGVIISHLPLNDIVPVQLSKENSVITEFAMSDIEKLGLLKMDFLGLKNLTTIRNTLDLIKEKKGITFDINKIPLDDKETFELLTKGETDGVFQLESGGMKKLVRDLKPSVFEDLGALVALFRPGPLDSGMVDDFVARKHGRQEIKYPHPCLEPILKDTYGTIVYQEQIMQIAQAMAGYTLGQADILRRAMGKKKHDVMEKQKAIFIEGSKKNGIDEKIATDLFDTMAKFAAYCFNRSHSAAYAFVAYQTAYLKAHYPVEYMAALLSSVKNDQEKTQAYIAESQKYGIKILPPDINFSSSDFTPDDNNIRFGLGSIKGVGQAVIEIVEKERQEKGPFKSVADFASRLDSKCVNRKTLESLFKTGAFNELEPNRKKLIENIDNIINFSQSEAKSRETGQVSLFAAFAPTNDTQSSNTFTIEKLQLQEVGEDYPDSVIQNFEKEFLGFYITSHPLKSIIDKLPFLTTHNIVELQNMPNDKSVTICGLVISCRQIPTKKDPTKFLKMGSIEDLTSKIDFVAFHKTLLEYGSFIESGQKIIVSGKVSRRDEQNLQIVVDSVKPIENSNLVKLKLKAEISYEQLVELKDFMMQYKGQDPLIFIVNGVSIVTASCFWLQATNQLICDLKSRYGTILDVEMTSLDE